jgi:hypothetical protein
VLIFRETPFSVAAHHDCARLNSKSEELDLFHIFNWMGLAKVAGSLGIKWAFDWVVRRSCNAERNIPPNN